MNKLSRVNLHTGRSMPVIGLGTWELTDDTAAHVVEALELGYRMIDTAADYGSQPGIGKALRRITLSREDIYLVTKVEEDEDAYEAVQRNLDELDQTYSDLVLIHRPPKSGAGEELWEGLVKAKSDGIARDIGVSNYSTDQLQRLIDATGETPAVNQIEWTPFGHSEAMLSFCREREIVIQAYSPLTRGERLENETLLEVASRYDKTPGQVLIRWNLQRGTVPLPKANRSEHLREDIDVFDFEISEADMRTLDELDEKYSALTELQYV